MKELKKVGLKVTIPRVTILELLQKSKKNHHSAESLYSELRATGYDVGLATVYRVLSQFEQAGILIKHNFEGGQAIFELDKGEHHDHLICLHCEKIVEFSDSIIENRQHEIAEERGFTIEEHSLVLYGICESCKSSS